MIRTVLWLSALCWAILLATLWCAFMWPLSTAIVAGCAFGLAALFLTRGYSGVIELEPGGE